MSSLNNIVFSSPWRKSTPFIYRLGEDDWGTFLCYPSISYDTNLDLNFLLTHFNLTR